MASELSTSDLYYAAFLQASGALMTRTDRVGTRFFFVFPREQEGVDLDDLQQGWVNNTAEVPGQQYAHHIKTLKATVHTL